MQLSTKSLALCVALTISPAPFSAAPQNDVTASIELVRPAVVQVIVVITDVQPKPLPKEVALCFSGRICVVGTGFFDNDAGDVVTASHVASDVQKIIAILAANGIHGSAEIGVNMPNVETKNLTISSGAFDFEATLLPIDTEHDVAAFRPSSNPFKNLPQLSRMIFAPGADLPKTRAVFLHLSEERPMMVKISSLVDSLSASRDWLQRLEE
jgi:S1-C subfamily serine protease